MMRKGEELADDVAAHEAALQTARELGGWDRVDNASVVLTTCDGRLVTSIRLRRRLNQDTSNRS
jgi:hypothetical protein